MKIVGIRIKPVYWLSLVAVLVIGSTAGLIVVLLDRVGNDVPGLDFIPPASAAGVQGATGQLQNSPTRYVAAGTGSDSNPGTSDRPWKTIQKAADWAARQGSAGTGATILVRAGNYRERVQVRSGGSAQAPLIFEAKGQVTTRGFTVRGDYVIIRGFEVTNTANTWDDGVGIFVEGSHCVIEDNYVHFATRGGVLLFGTQGLEDGGSGCIVKNNRLYRNALMGIEINGRNHIVEGNEIWGTIQYHPKWLDPPEWVDADGIRFFGSGHVIRDNYIHHITFADLENVDPHIDCFQTWGPAYDIGFHRNWCSVLEYQARDERGKGFMIEEAYGPVRDLTITNNVILAYNHITAIDAENLAIVNNTFVGNPSFPTWALGSVEFFRSPGAVVLNNIFYNIQNAHIAADQPSRAGWKVSHNAIYRRDGVAPQGARFGGDVWNVDPQFRNPARNDFRLKASSSLIDAGATVNIPKDVTGQARPHGKGYDIGAYEYRTPPSTATATLTPRPSQTPTPDPWETLTPRPSSTLTPRPSRTPTSAPSPTLTPRPSRTPTPVPSRTPTPSPSPTLTLRPSQTPVPDPSRTPTPSASQTPVPDPSPTATPLPLPTPGNDPVPRLR